ncbi:MAG: DUF934 domain-containing protein [Cellvibrionales bacterium]|nr:DUF934 domain-containing protein [Cellvibrionales bacterium]
MPALIKDGAVIDNRWTRPVLAAQDPLPAGPVLVSLEYWNANAAQITARADSVGLLLQPDEDPAAIRGGLTDIPLIAIHFPAFTDGRGFSLARLLRERFHYHGELRAVGAPIRDQLSYLVRVGFNAFELAEHYDPQAALASLADFSDSYQAAADQPLPLFRRRG